VVGGAARVLPTLLARVSSQEAPESEMRRRIIDQVLEAGTRMNNGATSEEPRPLNQSPSAGR